MKLTYLKGISTITKNFKLELRGISNMLLSWKKHQIRKLSPHNIFISLFYYSGDFTHYRLTQQDVNKNSLHSPVPWNKVSTKRLAKKVVGSLKCQVPSFLKSSINKSRYSFLRIFYSILWLLLGTGHTFKKESFQKNVFKVFVMYCM